MQGHADSHTKNFLGYTVYAALDEAQEKYKGLLPEWNEAQRNLIGDTILAHLIKWFIWQIKSRVRDMAFDILKKAGMI